MSSCHHLAYQCDHCLECYCKNCEQNLDIETALFADNTRRPCTDCAEYSNDSAVVQRWANSFGTSPQPLKETA